MRACKRELSTLFAHMIYESGEYEDNKFNSVTDEGLSTSMDLDCAKLATNSRYTDRSCDFADSNS